MSGPLYERTIIGPGWQICKRMNLTQFYRCLNTAAHLWTHCTDLLVCGGYTPMNDNNRNNYYQSTCATYTIKTNTWSQFSSLPVAIRNFCLLTIQGRAYVFGGWNDDNDIVNTVYSFWTDVGWLTPSHMPTRLYDHQGVALDNGASVLLCGGLTRLNQTSVTSACYTYSGGMAWKSLVSMNVARSAHGMTVYRGAYNGNY